MDIIDRKKLRLLYKELKKSTKINNINERIDKQIDIFSEIRDIHSKDMQYLIEIGFNKFPNYIKIKQNLIDICNDKINQLKI